MKETMAAKKSKVRAEPVAVRESSTVTVSCRLPRDLVAWLDRLAVSLSAESGLGATRSDIVRLTLEERWRREREQ